MIFLHSHAPLVLVFLLSVVIGFVMVIVFRYTSDQKAIRVAKDRLKAHLLAVRLFQDQIQVVVISYWRIVRSTGRYLRLAFMPFLYVSVPLILLLAQVDRYLGYTPIEIGKTFLVKVQLSDANVLDQSSLRLPPGLVITAPAVHVPAQNEIIWRVLAEGAGQHQLELAAGDQTFAKSLEVSGSIKRLSQVRLRDRWWERIFVSGEPALPTDSPFRSISVSYPGRTISFAWLEWNWIWLFFVLSLIFGFLFKTILRIEI
jgi:uncharacterized membrane protein (DUF106 family)